jgi:transposase
MFSMTISASTIFQIHKKCYENLESVSQKIKDRIIHSEIAHFDESGINCQKKLSWLHVASTQTETFYQLHPKRGREAMYDIGILTQFQGKAVHDHWQSYFDYDHCDHVLCNTHHLRELKFISEQEKEDMPMHLTPATF